MLHARQSLAQQRETGSYDPAFHQTSKNIVKLEQVWMRKTGDILCEKQLNRLKCLKVEDRYIQGL